MEFKEMSNKNQIYSSRCKHSSVSYASLNEFEVLARAAWLAVRLPEPLHEED
jgi:hypothetical protein